MKRRTVEEKYNENVRRQRKILEDFAEHEIEWAGHLMTLYRLRKKDMPDDEYRACAFFLNKEFSYKPGSLTLCYEMYNRCNSELPEFTKEQAFDLLRFRYKIYAKVLITGGYDERLDW